MYPLLLATTLLLGQEPPQSEITPQETIKGVVSSWKKDTPGIMIAWDERGFSRITGNINGNLNLIQYQFPPYDGRFAYVFVFVGAHRTRPGPTVTIDRIEVVPGKTPGKQRIQVTAVSELLQQTTNQPSSGWLMLKVLKTELPDPARRPEVVLVEKRITSRAFFAEELPP